MKDEQKNRQTPDDAGDASSPDSEKKGTHATDASNPPRTTTDGWLTTPKFGSATSGGGELEPGPERD